MQKENTLFSSKNLFRYGALIFILLISYSYFADKRSTFNKIQSFEECKKGGYPIMESYPEICKMPGKQFINEDQLKQIEKESEQARKHEDVSFITGNYFLDGERIYFNEGVATTSLQHIKKLVIATSSYKKADLTKDGTLDTVFLVEGYDGRELKTTSYLGAALGLSEGQTGLSLYLLSRDATHSLSSVTHDTITLTNTLRTSTLRKFTIINNTIEEIK